MPNHCGNTLSVSGPVKDLAKFKDLVRGSSPMYKDSELDDEKPLTFHAILPVPSIILKQDFGSAGYDWQNKHWGTKWDAYDVDIVDESEDEIVYTFTTAWGPVSKDWILAASKRFPKLMFFHEYSDEGAGFRGSLVVCDSIITNAIYEEHAATELLPSKLFKGTVAQISGNIEAFILALPKGSIIGIDYDDISLRTVGKFLRKSTIELIKTACIPPTGKYAGDATNDLLNMLPRR